MTEKRLSALALSLVGLFVFSGCHTLFGVTKITQIDDSVDDAIDLGTVDICIVVGDYEVGKDEDDYEHCYSDTLDIVDGKNAGYYFRTICNAMDIECVGVDSGYITQIGDYVGNDTDAWLFYVNGELSDVGIAEVIPSNGDDIVLSYTDWTKAFAE